MRSTEIYSQPPSHSFLPSLGSPKNLIIHTITQSLTLSNFLHKTPGKFKFDHNTGRVENLRFMKIYSQPPSHSSLLPLGSPKKFNFSHNFRIFNHVQNFLQDTWRIQIWTRQVSCGKSWTWSEIVKVCKKSNFWGLPRGRRDKCRSEFRIYFHISQFYLCCGQIWTRQVTCRKSWTTSKIM